MTRYYQRVPIVDPNAPEAWGRDDITGLPVMHSDLVKYYEYIGTGLQWTGMMTHYKDLDQPNPQLCPPRLKPDPVPIDNPRYLTFTKVPPVPENLDVMAGSTTAALTWDAIPSIDLYSILLEASFLQMPMVATSSTNSFTLTNLIPNSSYFVSVASVIQGVSKTSNGQTQTVTTQSAYGGVMNMSNPTQTSPVYPPSFLNPFYFTTLS